MKKFLSLFLAVGMAMSMAVCANAAEANKIGASGSSGQTMVNLTAAAATFDVTVPTGLEVDVAVDGSVTCATEAKIVNNSAGAVKVTAMSLSGTNGWASQDYDTMDVSKMKVGTKAFAFEVNGVKTTGADTVDESAVTEANFPVMAKTDGVDGGDDEIAITYDAIVAPQATAITGEQMASVVFTIGWYMAE